VRLGARSTATLLSGSHGHATSRTPSLRVEVPGAQGRSMSTFTPPQAKAWHTNSRSPPQTCTWVICPLGHHPCLPVTFNSCLCANMADGSKGAATPSLILFISLVPHRGLQGSPALTATPEKIACLGSPGGVPVSH
jgi:hypothetical protein